MTGRTDDALVLMERSLVSRDPLELALAGFLSSYKGRTFDKQRRVIKHYANWCLQNDLPPLQAKRPHIELFVRWCETQPWTESYICQHAQTAGCRHITPHGLRRTFCTAGLVSGLPMRDMQIALRHADPRTTGLYDMAKNNEDLHASHRVAAFLARHDRLMAGIAGGCDQLRDMRSRS